MAPIESSTFDTYDVYATVHPRKNRNMPENFSNLCTFVIELGTDFS